MNPITIKELLEAGAHFGHQTKRWNPKMKRYIFGKRNGIYIIDLQQTVVLFQKAADFVTDLVSRGGNILFVGTKRQAQETVVEEASRAGMPFVNTRWLGGTLTNFPAIKQRIERYRWLESMGTEEGKRQGYTKKELIGLDKEQQKLKKVLEGLRDLNRIPSAVFVIDPSRERIAVTEARKLGIPVVAVVDTNCDPDEADFPIPGNDDAIRAIRLFASRIADAALEGAGLHARRSDGASKEPAPSSRTEPGAAPAGGEGGASKDRGAGSQSGRVGEATPASGVPVQAPQ